MSLAETQELLATMKELMAVLQGIQNKTDTLVSDSQRIKEAGVTFRQVERLALRWLVLAQKMGLPENIDMSINKIAQLIVMIRMAQMSLNMMAATNPFTMALGITGFIGTIAVASALEGY